jgi:hypothetical protein
MNFEARLLLLLLGLSVLAIAINMVRTKRLRESYALLWLLVGIGLTISPFIADFLDRLALRLGFDYAPALLLMLAIIGLLLLIFLLSLSISRNSEQIKTLVQEVGLLRHEIERLQSQPPSAHRDEKGGARSETGPSSEETGPSGDETGPSRNETGPSGDETGPGGERSPAIENTHDDPTGTL